MNLGNFYKRLRRDLSANPKKAGILGVMILVACYFWAPLVMGALPAAKKGSKSVASSDVILTDDPLEAGQPARRSKKAFGWERTQQAIASDGFMASAELDRAWRNPFAALQEPLPSLPEPPMVEAAARSLPPEIETTPEEAGLTLQGVLVGRGRRAATISGEVYREGEIVPAAAAGCNAEYYLTRITTLGVQLQAGDKQHWLELSKSKLAPGDEFVRGKRPQ